jgi:hypothetical protein
MNNQIFRVLLLVGMPATLLPETELFTCAESGSRKTYFKVCVSDTGNVTLLKSPLGMEHIRVHDSGLTLHRNTLEGYGVCWEDLSGCCDTQGDFQGAYDFGNYYDPKKEPCQPGHDCPHDDWSYRWKPVHKIEQPNGAGTFPLWVFRNTSLTPGPGARDGGIVELKQEFNVDPEEREITVAMTLYNRSGQALKKVILLRGVSLAIDNTAEGCGAEALLGKQSVIQYDRGDDCKSIDDPAYRNRNAVSLAAVTRNYPVKRASLDFSSGYNLGDICDASKPRPTLSWFSNGLTLGELFYELGTVQAGASRTVKFAYRVF